MPAGARPRARTAGAALAGLVLPGLARRLAAGGTPGAAVAAAVARGVAVVEPALVASERHPLVPAAVRVERTRSQGRRRQAEQVAVTMWFGQGPALPSPGGSRAARVGVGLLGAAAAAAATAAVARVAERRAPQRLTTVEETRLLAAPSD